MVNILLQLLSTFYERIATEEQIWMTNNDAK